MCVHIFIYSWQAPWEEAITTFISHLKTLRLSYIALSLYLEDLRHLLHSSKPQTPHRENTGSMQRTVMSNLWDNGYKTCSTGPERIESAQQLITVQVTQLLNDQTESMCIKWFPLGLKSNTKYLLDWFWFFLTISCRKNKKRYFSRKKGKFIQKENYLKYKLIMKQI